MKRIMLLFLPFLLCRCVSDPTSEVIENLSSEISIQLSQAPSVNGSEILFELESVDHFDCEFSSIESTLIADESSLQLDVLSINIDDHCSPGEFPAKGSNHLFVNNGEYIFTLQLDDLSQQSGSLIISDELFEINIESGSGFNFKRTELHRIPDNHLWAYHDLEEGYLNILMPKMLDFVEINENLRNGSYGIFEISDESESIQLQNNFLIFRIKDLDGFKDVINEFRISYPEAQIEFTTSTGEII